MTALVGSVRPSRVDDDVWVMRDTEPGVGGESNRGLVGPRDPGARFGRLVRPGDFPIHSRCWNTALMPDPVSTGVVTNAGIRATAWAKIHKPTDCVARERIARKITNGVVLGDSGGSFIAASSIRPYPLRFDQGSESPVSSGLNAELTGARCSSSPIRAPGPAHRARMQSSGRTTQIHD